MTDVPVELVVAAFSDEEGANRAFNQLKQAKKNNLIDIKDSAVIRRDENNKLHISETGDMSGRKGAVIGGVIGAAVGIIAAPAVLVAGATGALVGGLAAKLRDSGFPNDRLRAIGDSLKPGTSALVAVVEHKWVAQVEQELHKQTADVITEAIKGDIAEQLEAGKDVTYAALASSDAVVVERSVTGDEPMSGEPMPGTEPTEQPPSQPS